MFTLKTSYSQVHPDVIACGACEEALDFLVNQQNKTLQEALDLCQEDWLGTAIGLLLDKFDEETRKYMLSKIQDPIRALNFYVDMENLTDEEDEILRAKFVGIGTKKERELSYGRIKRKKSTTIVG